MKRFRLGRPYEPYERFKGIRGPWLRMTQAPFWKRRVNMVVDELYERPHARRLYKQRAKRMPENRWFPCFPYQARR